MNAGGVPNACKSNGSVGFGLQDSGERLSNTKVTCPKVGDNPEKSGLIPHTIFTCFVMMKGFGRLRRGLDPIRLLVK